jgi:hypothetical protein
VDHFQNLSRPPGTGRKHGGSAPKPPGYLTPNDEVVGYLRGTGGDADDRAR